MAQINARSETVFKMATFKENFERRRGLIPADGFYEWKRSGKSKQPFHFAMKDDSPFAFAGIWDRWKSPEGRVIEFCAILTAGPNELLRDVHDRMPVVLRTKDYQEWLSVSDCPQLIPLMVPLEAGMVKRFPVSSAVNDPQNDIPECIQVTPELAAAQTALF
jgi:putative SOS response-associated peptidase YedK